MSVSPLMERYARDPEGFMALMWPGDQLYDEQWGVALSVRDNDQTVVPAGNMLGKDYGAGFICVWFFCTRHPCRIVTTSAKDDHLRVLWGEINHRVQTARLPLDAKRGGNLLVNHQNVRKLLRDGRPCPISYMTGMVASEQTEAAMQGHHVAKTGDGIPRTLFVADECSSVPDNYWRLAGGWANRMLAIGNTWPCDNFFKHAVKGRPGTDDRGGDLPRWNGDGYHRRVIRIRAVDSPNVKHSLMEIQRGLAPSGDMVVPGVKDWFEYIKNRATMSEAEQAVMLDAEWYEGKEVKLFPQGWLDHARRKAEGVHPRDCKAEGIGCDPAEGGDSSSWCVVGRQGVLDLVTLKTPDTSVIPGQTIDLMRKWNVPAERVCFDRGGGGKQHADNLRARGHNVQSVGFGEAVSQQPKRSMVFHSERVDMKESAYAYKNRRAELYGDLSNLMDPNNGGFGVPVRYGVLFQQLLPIPRLLDQEGRIYLPPKNKPPTQVGKNVTCLVDLIGHSPDEADSLVLAVHAMLGKSRRPTAGVA